MDLTIEHIEHKSISSYLMDEINLVLYNIYDPVKIYVQLKV